MLAQEVLEWPLDALHDQETLAMGMKKAVTSFSGNVIGSEFPVSGINKWINFIEHLHHPKTWITQLHIGATYRCFPDVQQAKCLVETSAPDCW